MVTTIAMNRGQILVETLANYLETGAIFPSEVDRTAETLMEYNDLELITALKESRIARELLYAIKNFRLPN